LKYETLENSARRIAAIKNETWGKRINEIFEVVKLHLRGKRVNQYAE